LKLFQYVIHREPCWNKTFPGLFLLPELCVFRLIFTIPDVDIDIVKKAFSIFVDKIEEIDGNILNRTTFDNAIFEIMPTKWSGELATQLAKSFSERHSEKLKLIEIGTYCGMIEEFRYINSTTGIAKSIRLNLKLISKDDQVQAVRIVLGLSFLYYNQTIPIETGLIKKFLDMLSWGKGCAHAASWALKWLNHKKRGERRWIPTDRDIRGIKEYMISHEGDDYAVSLLNLVLINDNFDGAIDIVKHIVFGDEIVDLEKPKGPTKNYLDTLTSLLSRDMPESFLKKQLIINVIANSNFKSCEKVLRENLSSTDSSVRKAIVESLSNHISEECYCKLISRDFDCISPFWDPNEKITIDRQKEASITMNISIDEVRKIFHNILIKYKVDFIFD